MLPMLELVLLIAVLVFSIVLHEYAHGWTANRLGDPTAKLAGRLTLNPIKHIDPVGTIILPGILMTLSFLGYSSILLGWAKPVPVNFFRLRRPKTDMMWVALAGPLVNIALAMALAAVYRLGIWPALAEVLLNGIFVNVLLAVFNMVPVPPLDGSRVVMGLLPDRAALSYARIEPYGIFIVFGLLYFGLFDHVLLPAIITVGALMGINFA